MTASPSSIQIRPATEADKPVLREIYLRCRQQWFTWLDVDRIQLADFDTVTEGEPILVALCAGQLAGFISWWPPNNFIHNLFVDPGFTRRGIGRELLATCLLILGRPATLKCAQLNAAALAFYERLGWRVAGEGETVDGGYFLLQLD